MSDSSSSAQEHYLNALRLLRVADDPGQSLDERFLATSCALVESQLAALPRRVRLAGRFAYPAGRLPPALTWGDEDV